MRFIKNTLTTLTLTAVAGAMLAQTVPAPAPHRGPARSDLGMLSHMTTALALTDAQKAQAQTILQDARTAAKPIHQALQVQRQAIEAAIAAGKSPDEVQQLAQSEGTQLAQLEGIHAAAMAKFHATLTPDQQTKFATLQQTHKGAAAWTPGAMGFRGHHQEQQ